MSRDANGSYSRVSPPGASGYQPSTVIKSTEVNSEINDLGQEITNSIDKGGRTTPTANLPMGSFKHTGVNQSSASGEYVEFLQWVNARRDGWVSVSDTWTYASADSPIFVITVPTGAASKYGVGMRIQLTQTTVKYFIVVAVTDTTLTVYGGTDYTLANAAISAISTSNAKCPLSFPVDPAKWTVTVTDTSQRSQASAGGGTWYNLGTTNSQIVIPIGAWQVSYQVAIGCQSTAAQTVADVYSTLSTANNTESDATMTAYQSQFGAAATQVQAAPAYRWRYLTLAAKATYYLNAKTGQANNAFILFQGSLSTTVLKAVCAYL